MSFTVKIRKQAVTILPPVFFIDKHPFQVGKQFHCIHPPIN